MAGGPLSLYVFGRLHGVTRLRLAGLVAKAGGHLMRRPSSRVNLMAVGHGTALAALADGPPVALPQAVPPTARLVSELGLKRLLGVAGPLPEEHRALSATDLARSARLDLEVVPCLSLYDVLEPVDGCYGYRDLLAAREVARLLRSGVGLDAIVEAAVILRHAGRRLSETRLSEAPWGEIVQEVAGRLGRLDGQLTLPLDEHCLSVDEVFQRAEQSELEGDLATAERWYRVAMRMDRKDPVLPFNLGNVLDGQGRYREASLAYQEAIARDPTFAEGWLNLGVLSENGGRIEEALTYYGRSVEARPDYADAVFALARLLTAEERYEAALPLWERYLRLELASENAARARRLAALCRLGLSATQTPPGAGVRPPSPHL